MNKNFLKLIFIFVSIIIMGISSIRIYNLNSDLDNYTVHYEEVNEGDIVNISNIELKFGKLSDPLIQDSPDFEGEKVVNYKIPIIIENKNKIEKNMFDGSIKIFVNYKTFYDAAIIKVQRNADDTRTTEEILSQLKNGEPIKIIAESDLVEGEFFNYYTDYGKDKIANIIFVSSPSKKGINAYYYRLNS